MKPKTTALLGPSSPRQRRLSRWSYSTILLAKSNTADQRVYRFEALSVAYAVLYLLAGQTLTVWADLSAIGP
jgi:hypothetical protein